MNRINGLITYSMPIGAEIYIDDNPVLTQIGTIATTPSTIIDIPEGQHSIIFKMAGYIDEYRTIYITPQDYIPIDILLYPDLSYQQIQPQTLQPSPGWPSIPIPQTPYGHIVASTIPDGAEIYIDGQPVSSPGGGIATTPSSILDIPVGMHTVTFRKQGYFDENIDVLIQNGLYSDASAVLRLRMATYPMLNSISNLIGQYNQYNDISFIEYLQPRERGIVHFDTQPQGARIYVDGQLLTDPDTEESIKTPASVLLFEGRRDFTLELENHYPANGYVGILSNSRVDIFKYLEPIPEIRSQNQSPHHYEIGDIFVDSNPRGAYIYIDGIPLLNEYNNSILTPARITGVMEGVHEVQISLFHNAIVQNQYYSKKLIVDVIPNRLNIAYGKLQPAYY